MSTSLPTSDSSRFNPVSKEDAFAVDAKKSSRAIPLESLLRYLSAFALLSIYLSVGAFDWWALLRVFTDDIPVISQATDALTRSILLLWSTLDVPASEANFPPVADFASLLLSIFRTVSGLPSMDLGASLDSLVSTGFLAFYWWAYVARHTSLLRSTSQLLVQWDKTLFEDVLDQYQGPSAERSKVASKS